jgi:VanZ family protein
MLDVSNRRKLLRAIWLTAILVIIVGSLLPSTSAPMQALDAFGINDKVEHGAAYAFLAFLPAIHERKNFIIAAALGAVALGVALEFAQLYSGWRDFEIGDMVADAAGVSLGLAAGIPLRSKRIVRSCLLGESFTRSEIAMRRR